ncbi:Uncharacterized protein Rs2_07986 [Raphanus sativus]|nr:Uncharacterized protein Rs2_07986 [Raphanus sativus]
MGFSTETSVGKTGTWARCNRHREHYELVYLLVKIRVVLNEKWRSKLYPGTHYVIEPSHYGTYFELRKEIISRLCSCFILLFLNLCPSPNRCKGAYAPGKLLGFSSDHLLLPTCFRRRFLLLRSCLHCSSLNGFLPKMKIKAAEHILKIC